jgi:hypothetical protein
LTSSIALLLDVFEHDSVGQHALNRAVRLFSEHVANARLDEHPLRDAMLIDYLTRVLRYPFKIVRLLMQRFEGGVTLTPTGRSRGLLAGTLESVCGGIAYFAEVACAGWRRGWLHGYCRAVPERNLRIEFRSM